MKFYGQSKAVADRIVDAFQHPEQLPAALAPMFIHRTDDLPCRRWSFANQFVIALCGTADARGIRQWNDAGRTVKPGSKAIHILAPCSKTITSKDTEGHEREQRILYGFRSVPVFAMEDTQGDPLPDRDPQAAAWISTLPLLDVAESWGIRVDSYSHRGNAPQGYYQYGTAGESIMLGVENLSTWTHELVHAADHRLGGLREDRWHREIVAELGGAVLLTCLGKTHDADLGGAYRYIQSYAAEAKMDITRACIEVLNRVCACVALILESATTLQATVVPA
jgi:hypothetical protein